MLGIGSLLAAEGHHIWLFRITGETAKRWQVKPVRKPDGFWSSPASGCTGAEYFDKGNKRLIPVRDEAHFEELVELHGDVQSKLDILKSNYLDAVRDVKAPWIAARAAAGVE